MQFSFVMVSALICRTGALFAFHKLAALLLVWSEFLLVDFVHLCHAIFLSLWRSFMQSLACCYLLEFVTAFAFGTLAWFWLRWTLSVFDLWLMQLYTYTCVYIRVCVSRWHSHPEMLDKCILMCMTMWCVQYCTVHVTNCSVYVVLFQKWWRTTHKSEATKISTIHTKYWTLNCLFSSTNQGRNHHKWELHQEAVCMQVTSIYICLHVYTYKQQDGKTQEIKPNIQMLKWNKARSKNSVTRQADQSSKMEESASGSEPRQHRKYKALHVYT